MSSIWPIVLPILNLIVSAATPELKAAALAELKTLEAAETDKPFLEWAIKLAESMLGVAAA